MEIELTEGTDLARLLEESEQSTVVLFLFDPYCPINLDAREELESLGLDVHMIDVARRHRLGMEVQLATGVRHQSPQVLVLRGREAVWHASHRGITADAVREALERVPA